MQKNSLNFRNLFKVTSHIVNHNFINNIIVGMFFFLPIISLLIPSSSILVIFSLLLILAFTWSLIYFCDKQIDNPGKKTVFFLPIKDMDKWNNAGFINFIIKLISFIGIVLFLILIPILIYVYSNFNFFNSTISMTAEELSALTPPTPSLLVTIIVVLEYFLLMFYLFPVLIKSYTMPKTKNIFHVLKETTIYIFHNIKLYIKIYLFILLIELIAPFTIGIVYLYSLPFILTLMFLFFDEERAWKK